MKGLADEIRGEVEAFHAARKGIDEATASRRLRPDAWTLKEIVCHLVDSAANNHQRFTRLQLVPEISLPGYEAEPWVAAERPNALPWRDLLDLWRLYNLFLCNVVEGLDPAVLGRVWHKDGKDLTLEHIATDYLRHLRAHFDHFGERLGELERA
jgi:hypothetical protein